MYTAEQQKILESLKLTPKDNFLRVLKGEIPERVPLHNMGFVGYNNEATYKIVGPFLFDETHLTPAPNGRYDIWGVKYVSSESTNFGCIPECGNYILDVDDLENWRDYIKAPEMPEHIDWEMMAKKDWETSGIDHRQSAAMGIIGLMPFQQLVAFMGFENTFIALAEEPEICKEILNYMADLYYPICVAASEHYTMDCIYLLDDTASAQRPFISLDMYREFLKPVYQRLTKPFTDKGIPVQFHNCGHCEAFLDDMIDFGVKILDPSQTANDLLGIKKKYGRDFVLAGCWDWKPPLSWPNVEEEEIRQMVRDCVDTFAPGGAYMGRAGALGIPGDKDIARVNAWLGEEIYWYTRGYYTR